MLTTTARTPGQSVTTAGRSGLDGVAPLLQLVCWRQAAMAMKTYRREILVPLLAMAAIGMAAVLSRPVSAHCDGMDGPVVKAAQDALARNDVNLVLIWVRKNDEPEIRRAFEQTVSVRTLSPPAKDLADRYFFETLVRVHRTGEGAPYTGLKPAGRDLGPAIPAADLALRSGDITPLTNLLVAKVRTELLERYKKVLAARSFAGHDVGAGREYVEAYVAYIHFVEGIYEAAGSHAPGHYPEGRTTRPGDNDPDARVDAPVARHPDR